MKPTIGRIVHYFEPGSDVPQAAIITQVHSDVCVNLRVFHDGERFPRVTSVEQATSDNSENCRWEWPPRV